MLSDRCSWFRNSRCDPGSGVAPRWGQCNGDPRYGGPSLWRTLATVDPRYGGPSLWRTGTVRRHPETVLNTHGVITAICVTLMYTADSRSLRQITLLLKARSTRHDAVKHDGQLVTRFYDVTSWPCDELTGSWLNMSNPTKHTLEASIIIVLYIV